jgi:hypothetical protein
MNALSWIDTYGDVVTLPDVKVPDVGEKTNADCTRLTTVTGVPDSAELVVAAVAVLVLSSRVHFPGAAEVPPVQT